MPISFLRRLAGLPVHKANRVVGDAIGLRSRRCEASRIRRAVLVLLVFCLLFQPKASPELKRVQRVIAVRMARTLLDAETWQDVSMTRAANVYVYDWRVHEGPAFKERYWQRSLWQHTKWLWAATFVIMLCLSALALYIRLNKANDRQLWLSGMLITAQEKERSRLASEIHDDFSQRLAIIALDLENAEEAIFAAPDEAIQQVHHILNAVSEIGADLHTLSHRLHSSTLERLGLVPGVTALCKEFESQHGIEIDFVTDGVPGSVHPDAALCLFRIVQEGLRNIKKHSCALKAEVRLRRAGNKLVVSVCDDGVGFDVRHLRKKEGLGVPSMEERAYLLGGRFEIHSNPGEGTRIEASVPL